MKTLNAALLLTVATSLAAQVPATPPARASRPAPAQSPAAPAAPAVTVIDAPGVWAIRPGEAPVAVAVPGVPVAAQAMIAPGAPVAVAAPGVPEVAQTIRLLDDELPIFHPESEQGRVQGRVDAERQREINRQIAEQAREQARLQSEIQREVSRAQADLQRQQSQLQSQVQRELAQKQNEIARETARIQAQVDREWAQQAAQIAREQARLETDIRSGQHALTMVQPSFTYAPMPMVHSLPERAPAAWAQGDPADSLYKLAQQTMNSGDYRRAATLFKEIPQRYKYSQYAVDAMYWQAHSLYRVGSTPDLQEALQVLQSLKATYPSTRIRSGNADVGALQVRIAGVLNSRGVGNSQIVRDALEQNKTTCDNEEIQIRSAALSALMQTDAAAAQEYAIKMLAKKDDCSRELRSSAVFLIGNRKDPAATRTLIDVAKNDPSQDVRSRAIEYLGRQPGDDALAALEDLLKTSDDGQVQRSAIRALANNSNPRARAGIKALIERNDVSESQRMSALNALNAEMATTEDVNWLQSLYGKTESVRIKASIIQAMARLGGSQNEKWFTTLANNENESIDVRLSAIRQAGPSMDIAALGRLFDQTGQRQLRREIVRQLGNRREPETVDKLGEIAKNGTDPDVRSSAINALANKKDDGRAAKLLLQLLDRP